MVDINKAYWIVKQNNPGMKANTCNELNKYYAFSLVPENLKKGDGFANSSVYLIDKSTGGYKVVHFTEVWDEEILREIDVSTFI